MNRTNRASRILSVTLILGGVPPMLSGLMAMFLGDHYLAAIGAGIPELFGNGRYGLLEVVGNLQGGDAFVAGFERVVAAAYGRIRIKQLFALVGIFHSSFELWLLPTKLLPWCTSTPAARCSAFIHVEVWLFLALHVVLVLGFSYGLWASVARADESASSQSACR
jgi:hypothetical protein